MARMVAESILSNLCLSHRLGPTKWFQREKRFIDKQHTHDTVIDSKRQEIDHTVKDCSGCMSYGRSNAIAHSACWCKLTTSVIAQIDRWAKALIKEASCWANTRSLNISVT
jgi:hypothetical protein